MINLLLKHKFFLIICFALLTSCGGGGGGGTDTTPSTSACSTVGLDTRIINGTGCSASERSPFVRIFTVDDQDQVGQCSGTMLSSIKVLTAAHCFAFGVKGAFILIQDGLDNIESGNSIPITTFTLHPKYNKDLEDSVDHDIAIATLQRASSRPSLPVLISRNTSENEIVSIFGYGVDETQLVSDTLRSGQMKISEVGEQHFAAIYNGEGSNTCQGDSGGPAVASHNGQLAISGVTSSGIREDCQIGDKTFFVNLFQTDNADFIISTVPGVGAI